MKQINRYQLTSAEILAITEAGAAQLPVERALILLTFGIPDMDVKDIALMSIGKRNQYLFKLREKLFGEQMNCFARCPECQEAIEFDVSTRLLADNTEINASGMQHYTFDWENIRIQFRLINSADLIAASQLDPNVAEYQLLKDCVVQLIYTDSDQLVDINILPDEFWQALSQQLQEHDSKADIQLSLNCPACQFSWKAPFDIVAFLWEEIMRHTKQLLQEIHQLALAYGWTETETLSLQPNRRHYYLAQVDA